jgi:hypothetical protein
MKFLNFSAKINFSLNCVFERKKKKPSKQQTKNKIYINQSLKITALFTV